MKNVLELVQKNIKNLIRAKTGSLIVILGPLLVIFLAGLAFDNTNTYSVKIGAYRPEVSGTTTELLDQLRTQYKVKEYDTEERCKQAIENSDVNTCMVFDANFTIGRTNRNQISFYVDYSRINLVWTIMQTMTEEVGEQSLEASQSLTKTLIDTIEYTQDKINEEKQAIVTLTTQNELLAQNTQDLMTELGDVNLQLGTEFDLQGLDSAGTQLKQWAENSLSLGEKGLSKATSFIDAANALVKSSSASSQVQENLLTAFQKSVDDIKQLKSDMSKSKDLSKQAIATFDERILQIKQGVENTKIQLTEIDTSRQFSIRVLEAILKLLDESLVSMSHVQKAVNDIEEKISQIEIKDPEAITQPIVTSIKPITQEKTYLHYLFPILIVLIIMFTALLITPTLILLDKHSTASFRTYLTPVKDTSYILSSFITSSLILLVQVIVMLAITSIFFSTSVITNAPEALLILIVINSLFVLIGMMVGYLFNSEETATLAAVSIGAVFLFISDVIIPLESMPDAFAYIASFNPYLIGASVLRKSLLFDAGFLSVLPDLLVLVGYIIAAAITATGIYMMTRRSGLEKLAKKLTPVMDRFKSKKPKK